MKTIAVVLLVLGGLTLAYGGIDYRKNRQILEVGSVEITEQSNVPIPAIAGVIVMLGGLAFLFADKRRSGST